VVDKSVVVAPPAIPPFKFEPVGAAPPSFHEDFHGFDPDNFLSSETAWQKAKRKFGADPFIPIGNTLNTTTLLYICFVSHPEFGVFVCNC
jgi:hypothetical protein